MHIKLNRAITLACVVAISAMAAPQAFAGPNDPVTEKWARNNLPNSRRPATLPNWQIVNEGKAYSVNWKTHAPNPRFAVYDVNTPDLTYDDLVLDKETGLVWTRDVLWLGSYTNPERVWADAVETARNFTMGNRKGWSVPTIEEISTLIEPSQGNPALPPGHPFINFEYGVLYWSSTTSHRDSDNAWAVSIDNGGAVTIPKSSYAKTWPVRGGVASGLR